MILVDTSAFIEFLRATGSRTHFELRGLIEANQVVTTDPVVMEVLAGARDEPHAAKLRSFLIRFEHIAVDVADYEYAASIYRACRREGATVRSLIDCLISAVAIRNGHAVLEQDRDFRAIAGCTELTLHESPA